MLFRLLSVPIVSKKDGCIFKSYIQCDDHFSPSEIYINHIHTSSPSYWRSHTKASLSIQVLSGAASFSFSRHPDTSTVSSILLNELSSWRVLIYPNTWFSFRSLSPQLMLLCLSDIFHDPSEVLSL